MLSEKNRTILFMDQGVHLAPIMSGETEADGVTLINVQVRYSLRFKPEDRVAVQKLSKIDLPEKIGVSSIKNDKMVLCLGPDEWLLIADLSRKEELQQTFERISSKFVCSVVDVSHRNTGFSIRGPYAETMINTGCPLDLSIRVFPIGRCTRTVYESTEIIVLRKGEAEFHVEVWRSFAPYLSHFFEKFMMDVSVPQRETGGGK